VAFQASLYDYRFGLIALTVSGLGAAAGMAATARVASRDTPHRTLLWLAGGGVVAAVTVAALLVLPFGNVPTYLLLTGAVAAVSIATAVAVAGRVEKGSWRSVAILAAALSIAALGSPWLIRHLGGPVMVAAVAAVGLCLVAFSHRLGAAPKIAGSAAAVLVLITLQAPNRYGAPPAWASGTAALAKPLYSDVGRNGPATRVVTWWQGFTRTDVVSYQGVRDDLSWLFTNGAPTGLTPAAGASSDWLRRQFPLISLPLAAFPPQEALLIHPGGGLEIRMALDAGPHRLRILDSRPAIATIANEVITANNRRQSPTDLSITVAEPRAALRADAGRYDQIYLSIPYALPCGWGAPDPSEEYLYTKEALLEYWEHLKPGGTLVVLAAEELYYARTLLALWEALEAHEPEAVVPLVDRAWGFQLASLTPRLTPYQYLLIAMNRPVDDVDRSRLAQALATIRSGGLARDTSLSPLFEPGGDAKRVYRALHDAGGLPAARAAFSQSISWRLQEQANLLPSTDHRPLFSQGLQQLHLFLRWLIGVLLALLVLVLLLPLASERRLAHPDGDRRPPLPVLLGYFGAAAGGPTMAALLVACHSAPLAGGLACSLPLSFAALLAGGVVAIALRRGDAVQGLWLLALTGVAAVSVAAVEGILHLAPGWQGPLPLRRLVPAIVSLPVGLLATLLLREGAAHLATALPALLPWAWATAGLALPIAAITAFWIAQDGGWPTVWLTAAATQVAALAIGAWTLALARSHPAK
ncbi:MAG TPA: hypothetical protein VGA42_09005, partial [Gemmatimonadales bacterium]